MLTCTPSYGRDYKSAAAVKADFDAGKDFTINDMSSKDDGRQINKEDAKGLTLKIYFAKRTKFTVIEVK